MIKHFIICLLMVLSLSELKGQSNRVLKISKDSVLYSTYSNYDNFSFKDSSGYLHEGKLFMPNDSEFYFLNYFGEKTGRTYQVGDIAEVDVVSYPIGTQKKKKGRVYLSAGMVILILVVTNYVGAIYLIGREISLLIREGPGHSYNPYKHKRIIKLLNPSVQISSNAT